MQKKHTNEHAHQSRRCSRSLSGTACRGRCPWKSQASSQKKGLEIKASSLRKKAWKSLAISQKKGLEIASNPSEIISNWGLLVSLLAHALGRVVALPVLQSQKQPVKISPQITSKLTDCFCFFTSFSRSAKVQISGS